MEGLGWSGVKLRPMVLLCHSARSVASRRVMGKRGDVEREQELLAALAVWPCCEVLKPARVESPLSLGVRCIVAGLRNCSALDVDGSKKGGCEDEGEDADDEGEGKSGVLCEL